MLEVEVQDNVVGAAPGSVTAPDTEVMRVQWQGGDRFDIQVRDHTLVVDQPVDVGGADVGPTPTELFIASLASCVAFYVRRYLRRHDIDPTGLEVTTTYRMGTRPARVGSVDMEIHPPAHLPPERRAGLLAQASHCTVHNTLEHPAVVTITLSGDVAPAGRAAH